MPFLLEGRLRDQLKKLKEEFGIIGIKAEFEAEGSSYDDVVRLRHLTGQIGKIPLHVKIGGVEAVRDIIDCLEIGVDGIIAPMVESAFGAKKFITAVEGLGAVDILQCSINIETKNSLTELKNILHVVHGVVNNITIGRSDLSSSYMDESIDPNSIFITKQSISIAKSAKNHGYSTTMGGNINLNTVKLFSEIPELKQLFKCVETRKVIIPSKIFTDNPVVLQEALKFEEMYILTKKEYLDRRLKSELNRLTGLKTRLV
jgi:4-hydroxy-2-oxoheptanedioate aldolase